VRSGRKCDGYQPYKELEGKVPVAPAPRRNPLESQSSFPSVIPMGGSFDTQEGQYFQVFRTHAAGELSGYFDSEFWTRSVL
jgi:hypothetical protein